MAFGIVLGVLALAACGSSGVRASRAPAGSTGAGRDRDASQLLVSLAASLPVGADRCVLARPAVLGPEQHELFARVSQAEPFAWLPELRVLAYASAERAPEDGPSARVSVLALGIAASRARALLDERSGLALRWGDAPARCDADACPVRARILGRDRIVLERGAFPQAREPGTEVLCRSLAAQNPHALEVHVARGIQDEFALSTSPARTSAVLEASRAGFRVSRVDVYRSALEARAVRDDELGAGLMMGQTPVFGAHMRREQHGAELRASFDLMWEDLALMRDDDARAQAAEREADALARAQPPANAPAPARRQDVLSELGFRLDLAHRASGAERDAQLNAARALLEGALAAAPEDEGLALLLSELLVSEIGDGAGAERLAHRFADGVGARPRWNLLRRNAAALEGAPRLSERLIADGLAERRDAPALAREIVSRMRSGMSYELAEHAVLPGRH